MTRSLNFTAESSRPSDYITVQRWGEKLKQRKNDDASSSFAGNLSESSPFFTETERDVVLLSAVVCWRWCCVCTIIARVKLVCALPLWDAVGAYSICHLAP